ncbi:MAG: TonB-dependent receptor [Opitutus sp.]
MSHSFLLFAAFLASAAILHPQPVDPRAASTVQPLPPATMESAPPSGAAPAAAPTRLPAMEVTARRDGFYNSIDRKVYVVGQDIVSATGSASDLLQNVPSVQVDVTGSVSLRGDSGVSFLVNGKSSAQIDRDPAAALESLSADSIERVEVITNPSAKYKPDGTAAIINLVLKRPRTDGFAGSFRGSVGNDSRYNASLNGNYKPGKLNLFGRLSARQDSQPRFTEENRGQPDPAGGMTKTVQRTGSDSQRRSFDAEAGFDYKLGERTGIGATVGFGTGDSTGHSLQQDERRDGSGAITADFERLRTGPESERDVEIELTFTHEFDDEDRELTAGFQYETETETEDRSTSILHRTPSRPAEFERLLADNAQKQMEVSLDYVHPLADGAGIEAGYELEMEKSDRDSRASIPDEATGAWIPDAERTDRFLHQSAIHALYATYGRPVGRFGFLGGLRFEHAATETEQVTAGVSGRNDYARLYPSLHLTYDFADVHRLQLNYSHRVERPDDDDLNPYIDRDDPSHLESGNPALEPEDVHSVEAGYEYRAKDTTYLASIYHRYRYNGITEVTRFLDATTLITTPENLSTSRSSGLELGATTRWRDSVALNFGANAYRQEIDARNLGFTGRRQATAWDTKLNVSWEATDRLLVQVNTSYRAGRLTPQGERKPSATTNLGVRYDLQGGKTSFVATISDVFDTLRDRTIIDTPALQSDITRRRSSRIVYIGFVYRFGKFKKNGQEDLEFDDTL